MQQVDYLTRLLGFQGFYVQGVEIEKAMAERSLGRYKRIRGG